MKKDIIVLKKHNFIYKDKYLVCRKIHDKCRHYPGKDYLIDNNNNLVGTVEGNNIKFLYSKQPEDYKKVLVKKPIKYDFDFYNQYKNNIIVVDELFQS